MHVALYARVSTRQQQPENTIDSQVQALKHYIQQQGWTLLPDHAYLDAGMSGTRLDRPALDRLRDAAQRGEFDAVVVLSPDRLARNYAHQWLLIEELEKLQVHLIFLHNPFGDTPQGKLLTQMQGMIAEYERTQILERTRRGRLEKARRGEYVSWAYQCYGYRYLPKRHDSPPHVVVEPREAEIVRHIYQLLVEDHLSCRQITKRLNETHIPTPSGQNQVWQPATVRNILTNRAYAGHARYNYRQPALPRDRQKQEAELRSLKTGRRYRPASEGVWSEAPVLIMPDVYEPMVLVSDKPSNATGLLQTKLRDRERHETRRVGLEAMPLNQHIEDCHGKGQPCLKIGPAPMHHLLQMTNEREHREHGLHQHTVFPLPARTQFQVGGIALRGVEAGITQDNHPPIHLLHQPLKGVVRSIGGGTRPSHDQPPLIEEQAEFPPDNPAMIGEAFPADLLRAAALAHGVDQLDPIGVDDPEHGRGGQERPRPVLMGLQETKEPRPLGQTGEQCPIVARQPAIERTIPDPFERMQESQGDHLTGPEE